MFAPKPAVIKNVLSTLDAISRLTHLPEEGKAPWNHPKDSQEHYDYIVLGGGSAGCVVANRLAEDPKVKVLVLEAGYSDEFMSSRTPAVYLMTVDTATDWQFRTVPQPHANHRVMKQPRGKMLGGTSSMNAMMYHRGPASDYGEWEALGNPGWSYKECLPYFKKSEGFKDPAALKPHDQTTAQSARVAKSKYETHDPEYHGTEGPWQVSFHHLYDSAEGFIRANEKEGVKFNKDFNGESTLGVNRIQTFIQTDAVRSSLSRAFLKPKEVVPGGPSYGQRGTIRVVYGATIRRVLVQSRKGVKVACGAEFVDHNNVVRQVMAVREVLLCAGAFGSPHILLASGIGPSPQPSIPFIHKLPGVGANLADHLGLTMIFKARNRCATVHQDLSLGRALATFLQYQFRGTGGLSSQVGEAVNFVRLEDFAPDFVAREKAQGTYFERASGPQSPHFEIIFAPYYFKEHGDILAPDNKVYYTLIALLLNPRSSGTVKIAPSKSKKKIVVKNRPQGTAILDEMETVIDPHYLEDEWDVKCFAEAAKFIRRIAKRMSEDPEIGGQEVHPGVAAVPDHDEKAMQAFARSKVETYYHPTTTCKMGPSSDPLAVVDARLNVYGIDRLRVIDASVMPKLPAAHTCAPTVMIAERASDMIKEDWQDPVARTAQAPVARL